MLDVPVEFHEKDFKLSHPDMEAVTILFQELEFRRLIDNFTKTFSILPLQPIKWLMKQKKNS